MSNPVINDQMISSSRRGFFKGVGAGALGLSMLGGTELRGADRRNDLDSDSESSYLESLTQAGACNVRILSTDRRADLISNASTIGCDACPCPQQDQPDNFVSINRFTTSFVPMDDTCDRLFKVPVRDDAKLTWVLRPRVLNVTGPCGSIGSFLGGFRLDDIDSDGNPVVRFRGRVVGTIGYDPCAPPGVPGCCDYPRIAGTLHGRSPDGECIAIWTFCGSEDFGATFCDLTGWGVRITGTVVCNCPQGE